MLCSLSIRNFAIIASLDVDFGSGFSALTGETGAGKSILIGALELALGARASADQVRSGAARATVDAVFDLEQSAEAAAVVAQMGFELEEGRLLLSREVTAGGKSSARIAGRMATAAQLREIGEWLLDLHGQHEHQSLLSSARHRELMDDWAGASVLPLRQVVARAFEGAQSLQAEMQRLEMDARDRERTLDLYRFQVEEIRNAALSPGEEADLQAEAKRLANAENLSSSVLQAVSDLEADETGALALVSAAARALESAAAIDASLAPLLEAVRSASYNLEEAARDLARYTDAVEPDPQRLAEVEERLDLLKRLKRKYGDTVEEIIRYGQETAEKLDALTHSEQRLDELKAEVGVAQRELQEAAVALTCARRSAATAFEQAVLAELGDLALERARLEVAISPAEMSSLGADRVEMLFAANPGEPLRALARVASGGELSRVMLAIKSALARQEPLPTMVFDEIDVGVGGRTATTIGVKMASLARAAQVICITHLAQIASRADVHYRIEKVAQGDRAIVMVVRLSPEERVEELARMAGGELTAAALEHARAMLQAAG